MDDVVVMETYKSGIPEYTANLKQISQIQKDATSTDSDKCMPMILQC